MKVNLKKVIKNLFLVVIAVLGTTATRAQSVQKIGTNPTTISSSAVLELESTDKGFLPPRMTTAQRDAIVSPRVGLVIYNTTTNCLEHFNSSGWYNRCSGSIAVSVGGGNASSGGTAVINTFRIINLAANNNDTPTCSVGAGANGSPKGVLQGGVNQTMSRGVSTTGIATVTLLANVTTAGTYNLTTTTVNGVSFSASGTFVGTGLQTVILMANGTPTFAGNYIWVLNQTTATASLKNIYGSVLTTNAPLGSSYNAHFNGIVNAVNSNFAASSQTTGETFDTNTSCQNKPISAQGCAGVTTVTTSSGRVHNTVNINGQCWLQTNLIEVPSLYKNYTTIAWTTARIPGDQGYWGYYNTVDETGNSGWGTPGPDTDTNAGLLYQWCGAMNGTISERSRGICPAGWHIPSDCEWMYLEHGQGMSIAQQNSLNSRANTYDNQGTPGYKLLSQVTVDLNSSPPSQVNASGFSVLCVGYRDQSSSFYNLDDTVNPPSVVSMFWTSTFSTDKQKAYSRILMSVERGIERYNFPKTNAGSIRCLKD